jgi:hypothetical protein
LKVYDFMNETFTRVIAKRVINSFVARVAMKRGTN